MEKQAECDAKQSLVAQEWRGTAGPAYCGHYGSAKHVYNAGGSRDLNVQDNRKKGWFAEIAHCCKLLCLCCRRRNYTSGYSSHNEWSACWQLAIISVCCCYCLFRSDSDVKLDLIKQCKQQLLFVSSGKNLKLDLIKQCLQLLLFIKYGALIWSLT